MTAACRYPTADTSLTNPGGHCHQEATHTALLDQAPDR
jgi:hypothetical protein